MLNNSLPYKVYKRLWGDRKVFGLITNPKDKDWIAWQEEYFRFYMENQRGSIGSVVNNAGYEVMSKVNLKGKKVLEIGGGDIKHNQFCKPKTAKYAIIDNLRSMLEKSISRIKEMGVPIEGGLVWGLGRYFISRRWFKINTKINPDKIICWEHPNFITDIKSYLDEKFSKIIYSKKLSLSKLPLDMNLNSKFIYKI